MENSAAFIHPPILCNEKLNEQLFKNGYAHFPFLNKSEVAALRNLFFQYHRPDEVSGLYISANRKDRRLIYVIDRQMNLIIDPAIEKHFQNIKKLGSSFIVKGCNPNSVLHPHQDWSIVDETRYRSFTVWIPLQDITEENGAMYVLPGSHNWIRGYRHITIDSVYGKIYDLTWRHCVPIYMKAGEALVFDHALVHASKPNCTNEPRICATHGLISEDAEMRIYLNNNGSVEEYACTSDYYLEPRAQTGPHPFPMMKVVSFKPVQLDEAGFYEVSGIKKHNRQSVVNSSGKNWWERVKSLLS